MKSLTRLVFGTGILMCVFMMSFSTKTVAADTGDVKAICSNGPCNNGTGMCANGGPQLGCVCANIGGVTQGCF
jgi:hypothetical protein